MPIHVHIVEISLPLGYKAALCLDSGEFFLINSLTVEGRGGNVDKHLVVLLVACLSSVSRRLPA